MASVYPAPDTDGAMSVRARLVLSDDRDAENRQIVSDRETNRSEIIRPE
ncbi:hypothetical protein [uncultured Paracoccus sp.]|nr:hypothetical protein [uncultured Paracoccus sp.]